ncbi:PREDICTED: pre-miRNA 5'-monophosphate methyltransferase-like [Branchiostoma belcheri]|uniref:RNA methyltransferase n=1 Tax=Branchiostoma belcheri TaxID=7741 RepID=A0A6P4XCF1_BRABE|nr:PREDICTED: pre-miRNA 5'-monophosphate methyltransferase-like [Branchiostoma belcheri]
MAADPEFQPGAAPFGNFINYYSFNPPENRLKLLPKEFYTIIRRNCKDKPLIGLDIGCNTGVGLVCRLLAYFSTTVSQPTQHTDFHMLGCDIDNILIQRATENHRHTDHLTFQTLDYMDTEQRQESLGSYLQRFSRTKFDVTFCFSVTMWIHLQNGDSGLRDFLRSVSSNTWNFTLV